MRLGWVLLLAFSLVAAACSGDCTDCVIGDAGCPTCLPDGGKTRFTVYTIDQTSFVNDINGFEKIPTFQMTLLPSSNGAGIGFAYVEESANQDPTTKPRDAGALINYDIVYSEWNGGTVSNKQLVHSPVVNYVGVSLDYQASGEPAVAYLGFATAAPTPYDITAAYWYQNDAVVTYRSGGTWTEQTAVQTSGEAACGNGSCDNGDVVGLFPALLFDGAGALLAYKDVHFGSSPLGDYGGADLELALGGPTSWTHYLLQVGKDFTPSIFCSSTSARLSRGSHNRFIHGAGGNPALVSDLGDQSPPATSVSSSLYFTERRSGAWSCPALLLNAGETGALTNTENGPSLAYDSVEGYAVAVSNVSTHGVFYKNCSAADCTNPSNWAALQTVFQYGSSGYFASVAVNPDTHEPWVAHYFCSNNSGDVVTNCPASQRQLKVSNSARGTGTPGPWTAETVDVLGAFQTQMLYLRNPTRLAIGYRDPTSGALKLAVENP
jgi:hypothetical protein